MRPSKLIQPMDGGEEEVYVASDYATTGSCGVLYREEQYQAVRIRQM